MAVAIAPGFTEGPLPCIKLFTERILVSGSRTESGRDEEVSLPALSLSFDYAGTVIAASDDRERFFISQGHGVISVERDREREDAARAELERLGAVELSCLDGYEESFGSPANYLVSVDGDVHTYCAFTAQALPELRARGFSVEVAPDYPYKVREGDPQWYVDVAALEDRPDWFSCELGVELDGERVNLLDALLGLLDSVPDDEALSRMERRSLKFFALPVDDQRYVRVPRDLLWDLFEVLRELYSVRRADSGVVCRYQGGSIEALAEAIERHNPEPLRRYGERLQTGECTPPPADEDISEVVAATGLKATLRGYQQQGVSWLQRLRVAGVGGILADDMGLGKTLQTIAHLSIEHGRPDVDKPTLVVVPTSLIQNWKRELNRFAPHLVVAIWHGNARHDTSAELERADIIVTSYSLLVRERERWAERSYHYLILDEAQAIKNPRAAAREAAREIDADHRLCLSGTPVENHLGDLWSIFDFLMPGLLGSSAAFHVGYRTPIEQERNDVQMQSLRRTVTPFILRRTKDEVATDLPPKTLLVRPVRLKGDQRQLYESIRVAAHADVRRIVRTKGMAGSTIAILDALMKLRQVCCDPRLVRVSTARRVVGSAKLEFFFALLGEQLAEKRRMLVFSQFTSMLGLIGEGLEQRGIKHLTLTGSTQDRQAKCDAFNNGDADVFLISLKAGGTGLNLTTADTVVHYDPWWNPAAQAQATDRAHRIGQTRPVFVHQLIVAGSVEERMLELQRRKQELASGLVGSASQHTGFSESDLSDLFAPLDT